LSKAAKQICVGANRRKIALAALLLLMGEKTNAKWSLNPIRLAIGQGRISYRFRDVELTCFLVFS
jgi:hypothetical protein